MSKKLTYGSENVTSLYVGTQKVKKIYAGSELVYESTPPAIVPKGTIIKMNIDGTESNYLVIKCIGNVATVFARASIGTNRPNSGSYISSQFNTYLTDYYNNLSTSVKSAIVETTIQQEKWEIDSIAGSLTYLCGYDNPTKVYTLTYRGTRGSTASRFIYAPSIRELLEYFGASVDDTPATLKITKTGNFAYVNQIWCLFRDSNGSSNSANNYIGVHGGTGKFESVGTANTRDVLPCFRIDLTKISWSIVS